MQYYQTDHSSGARLIGGEMLDWSELATVGDLGVIPACVSSLLQGRTGPVLLAGPRAALLLEDLTVDTRIDVVVRGLPDARELSAVASLRSNVTVWCGGLERLEQRGEYAAIVVLDGPERVLTPDSPGMTTKGLVSLLSEHLAPEGVLATAVTNGMSIADWLELPLESRAVTSRPIESMALTLEKKSTNGGHDEPQRERFAHENANDRWWHGASGFADRPPYYDELATVFGDAGLTVDRAWANYPHPDHPAVMVDVDDLAGTGQTDSGWAATVRSRAVAAEVELFSSMPALTDPVRAVDQVFAAGLGVAMAPGWLLISSRTGSTVTGPGIVWGDRGQHRFWGAVWSAPTGTADQDRDAAVTFVPDHPRTVSEGPLERVLQPQEWPSGRSLESEFRAALASGNHQRIRRLLGGYAAWIRAELETLGSTAMAATMDNVTVTEDGLAVTDRSWAWHRPAHADVVIARSVRRAAMRLLRAGLAHPWRTDIAPDELAVTLMIMVGVDQPETVVAEAALVDAEWASLLAQVPAADREEFLATHLDAGRSQFTAMPSPSPGYRETVVRSSRMATELEVRKGQVEWLEAALRMRESRMASVERNIDDIRNSMSFKLGRVITAPARKVALSARNGVLRMLPRDLMDKAERAARRLLK